MMQHNTWLNVCMEHTHDLVDTDDILKVLQLAVHSVTSRQAPLPSHAPLSLMVVPQPITLRTPTRADTVDVVLPWCTVPHRLLVV